MHAPPTPAPSSRRLSAEVRIAVERALATVRAGAALLFAPLVLERVGAGGAVTVLALVAFVALPLATSAIAVLLTSRRLDPEELHRLALGTAVADVVTITGLSLALAAGGSSRAVALVALFPLVGAVKFDVPGLVAGALAVAAEEVARTVVVARTTGTGATLANPATVVLAATAAAVLVVLLVRAVLREREAAVREAARARALAADQQAARRELQSLHRVALAGLGELSNGALEAMLAEVAEQADIENISVVLLDADGTPARAVSSDPTFDLAPPPIDAGGPIDRVLHGDPALVASEEEVTALRQPLPGTRSQAVVPVRGRSGLIGALVAVSPDGDAYSRTDLVHLQRIADTMALVIEAARAYEREVEAADRLQELDRIRADFIAITSHELRTPLTAILGAAETLERHADLDDRWTPLLQALNRQGRRLHRLVDDLRTVGDLDGGRLAISLEVVEVDRVLDDALEALSGDDVEVAGQPGLRVLADPYRLGQVVTNLVRNAREHGVPPIELDRTLLDGRITLRVRDRGAGIDPAHVERLFERFVQGTPAEHHVRGSGLGLAIARELTVSMGGTIDVEHPADGGVAFVLRFPTTGRAAGR
ncbi:MAG: ATP-binding protein [Actinomycetes bacterium]